MTSIVLLILTLAAGLPVLVLVTQVTVACAARRSITARRTEPGQSIGIPYAILVPAHNEASGISPVLQKILSAMPESGHLLVVADNCSDNTAQLARQAGAEVIERFNEQLRGKGYALDFGIRHLAGNPPAVVIIIDADCDVSTDALQILLSTCQHTGRPVQASYLMHAPSNSGVGMKLAEFAWLLKNEIRPLGMYSLGLPCQLTGTGMAFPWHLIATSHLATGELVEDMQLGIDLAKQGFPPVFEPAARVTSVFPTRVAAQDSQRTRWEHGHLGMIIGKMPGLLFAGLQGFDWPIIAMALDLAIPPLALLAAVLTGIFVTDLIAQLAGLTNHLALTFALLNLLLFLFAILAAWQNWARQTLPLTSLFYIPIYILRKIPRYFRFLTNREHNWIRTNRGNDK